MFDEILEPKETIMRKSFGHWISSWRSNSERKGWIKSMLSNGHVSSDYRFYSRSTGH